MLIQQEHIPVLLDEVLNGLNLRPDGIYVDCTFGRGGHSRAILRELDRRGRLFVFDKDPAAVARAREMFSGDTRVVIVHGSFTLLAAELGRHQASGLVDGLLFDLGVSSPQLDNPDLGFSFTRDGVLDMRMDPGSGVSAAQWINQAQEAEIARVLYEYGEERYARRIAAAIVRVRAKTPITRTRQLAEIIGAAAPSRERSKDPATRSFLAIRIFVNQELEEITGVLRQVIEVLRPGGRLVVISFHSLEDRIVKQFLRREASGDPYPRHIPVTAAELRPSLRLVGRAIKPTGEEVAANPRARSAVLRIGEKLAA